MSFRDYVIQDVPNSKFEEMAESVVVSELYGTTQEDGSVIVTGLTEDPAQHPQFAAKMAEIKAERAAYEYRHNRAYPPVGEQLDMIYKSGVLDGTDWANAIAAVKTAHPKP